MSTLRQAVAEYLTLRRGLGFKLHRPGEWLEQFVSFLEKRGASYVTTQLALDWAKQSINAQPVYMTQRLSTVCDFARYRRQRSSDGGSASWAAAASFPPQASVHLLRR